MTSTHAPTAGRLLSNGRYFTFITAAGTGQSRRHGHVVNRWPGDPVEDAHGQFLYLRDVETGEFWSAGRQPVPCASKHFQASATPGQFHIDHEANGILSRLDIAVSPTDDLELRRLTLRNTSGRRRTIEVTSYFEAVLNWQAADIGHPAFSKLFLQTAHAADDAMLIVERRPRANGEHWPALFHFLRGAPLTEWETDRLKFLGRGRTAAAPAALKGPLSGTVGNVLDPCCALRTVIELPADGQATVSFVTGIAENREAAHQTAKQLQTPDALHQILADAERAERDLHKQLSLTPNQAKRFQALAAAMHAGDRRLRPRIAPLPAQLDANAVFGRLSIPRDRMLMLATSGWSSPATQELRLARDYLGRHGFFTNLLVWDDDPTCQPPNLDDRVFTTSSSTLNSDEKHLLQAAASLVVDDKIPVATEDWSPAAPPRLKPVNPVIQRITTNAPEAFYNGYGGFSRDDREYVMRLECLDRNWPPLPWANVIAHEHAGFLVTESGGGCVWARNSQANRLTPWSNEPVTDPHGEALYLRDELTGEVFSPFPGPVESDLSYVVRHGLGYSVFESRTGSLEQEVTVFVPRHHPAKLTLLKLTNFDDTPKRLSITAYRQLVMGSTPATASSLIVTHRAADGSLRAVNLAAGDFQGGIAFGSLTVDGETSRDQQFTCDRASFLGRFGTPRHPAALQRGASLDSQTGSGLDPCFVQQQAFMIAPGATVECVVLLGEAMTEVSAAEIVSHFRSPGAARQSLAEVQDAWREALGRVQVETPSRKLNLLVNDWLPYQTLGCRLWARSGFYQSSGAFGFRDQLQDAGNLIPLEPRLTREQILVHARHQFAEGDVLHWWHPEPIGRGLRTKFSDDLLWLPFVTADYVQATGDLAILEESVPFIAGPPLPPGEDEVYITPEPAGSEATLYEHCCRTIDRSLAVGAHGLPLMGCGDWNDGMNRVGREGRGESVWLGFFLFRILEAFLPFCERRSDADRVRKYSEHREKLRAALNEGGWDGEWYRRAYYDNGDPLGSKDNEECRIDAIAQAWAVLSGAAPPDRARSCMAAMTRELVSESDGIIRLLTPPFVNTPNDPGYIKGYVAGIRENGGQYTHAACWAVMAKAQQGENNAALRLWEMLTPISHTETKAKAEHYKGEPYCYPGDVYGAAPHVGRCGWTWYTGSSGWMYRVALESILGIRIENGDTLAITPCIPDDWPWYEVALKRPAGRCVIRVENPHRQARGIVQASSDKVAIPAGKRSLRIPLRTDGEWQQIRLVLGSVD